MRSDTTLPAALPCARVGTSIEIAALLGFRGRDEMIHRDDMAVG